jgi:RHS repeat-associated protein
VYGFGGELLAEYPTNGVATTPQKEYGYRNGQLLVTAAAATSGPPQNVTWTNAVGVSVSGNNLTRTAASDGWNAGARSTQSISTGDGYAEFTASETNKKRSVGLTQNTSVTSYQHINYGMVLDEFGQITIHEGLGVYGVFGTYTTGDTIRVAVEGGVVKYRKNGILLRTSTVAPTYPLYAGAATYTNGSTVSNAKLSSGGSSLQLEWLITDQLGTPRMILDQSGALANMKRHDYLPFGEELFAPTSGRTATQGYASGDGVRQHFTQKERDTETGLDYFGARYYASLQGRFTSSDPLMASARVGNPQTWNRYTYALNNPLSYVDPNGMKPVFRSYEDLTDDERRILDNSTVTVGKGKNAHPLSGKQLYDYMADKKNGMQKQLAGFLNQTAGLANITFANGRNALSYVKSVTGFTQERIYATVDADLHTQMESISAKKATDGVQFIGPEGQAVNHSHGETKFDVTFRENTPSAPQQLSFSSANYELMDKDTDEHCFDCSNTGSNVAHVLDGARHHIPLHFISHGGSDPKDIYGRLKERGIKPSYRWE